MSEMGGNMKKVIIKGTVLAVAAMFLLGGCGSGESSENDSLETESLEIQDPDSEINNTTGGSIPTIRIRKERKEWYTDDGAVRLMEANADRIEVTGEGFEALQTALSEQWSGLADNYDDSLEMAGEQYAMTEEKEYFTGYSEGEDVAVYRLDDLVASLCGMYYGYEGGAHGYYGYNGATFDVKSGKKLELEDILSDAEGFYDEAVSYIIKELEENYKEDLFPEYKETVETNTFSESSTVCWYLNNTGIVIVYGLYEVTPYAAGVPEVILPYNEFAAYIKEEYMQPRGSLIASVRENEDFSGLIGESGKVMLTTSYADEYSDAEVTVVSGDASETVGSFVRIGHAYVIKRDDGRSFLIFDCDYASDDFVTYVYEVTGGSVRACDKLDGAAWSGDCLGTDRIGLSMHLDVLGSYSGDMEYLLTNEGKLTQTEEIFAVNTSFELTVIKELPVTLEGEAATIPAGSKIKITGTDNAGTAYFQTDSKETGIIQYMRDDEQWQLLIDGISENEYFEMLPYAG